MSPPTASLRLARCPVCRARLTGEEPLDAPCRRCGSDLRLIRLAERQAEDALRAALGALDRGDTAAAQTHARQAFALVDHPTTRQLLVLAGVLPAERAER